MLALKLNYISEVALMVEVNKSIKQSRTDNGENRFGADSRFALSQWETVLLCNDVSLDCAQA